MEDDIYAMATEPILGNTNSSIYEEETQAIIGGLNDTSRSNGSEQRSGRESDYSICEDSPTSGLESRKNLKSFENHSSCNIEDDNAVDSDCDTLPASPVFHLHSVEANISSNNSPVIIQHFCVESPIMGFSDQENADDLDYPTQPLPERKVESIKFVDDSMDAPTQRLPENKKFGTMPDDMCDDEPTQILPERNSVCKDIPRSMFANETSMDAPTQKLPETQLLKTVSNENSMSAPSQPHLGSQRIMYISCNQEDSLDAPTQPLPQNKCDIDGNSEVDAVTQPLPKSQPCIKSLDKKVQHNLENISASPALLLSTVKSDQITTLMTANGSDDETQRIDFEPESLFEPYGMNAISPVPLHGESSIKYKTAASVSSTPYQHKRQLPASDAVILTCNSNRELACAVVFPQDSPSSAKEEESDAETLPGSPGFDLETPCDVVLGTQEDDEELSSPLKRSLAWKGLQNTSGAGTDSDSEVAGSSGFPSPVISPKKRPARGNKENDPVTAKQTCGLTLQHETASISQDRTECDSPVFDFDDSSEALADETQTKSPLSVNNEDSPAIIAETPFIEGVPSPRKKRKIIRRSGYCLLNDPSFLQHSTASEEEITERVSEDANKLYPPHLPDLESEESDLELTFASDCSSETDSIPSEEPFVGFTEEDRDEISVNLKLIEKVIDADEKELVNAEMQNLQLKPRRSSRKPVPNLRNSDLYDLSNSSSRHKRDSPLSKSPKTISGVDMEIASSEDEQEADFAMKPCSVSSTPSTTNVTVDMDIVSSCDVQDESTPKPAIRTRRAKRSVDPADSKTTTVISADISSRPAVSVSESPKELVKPNRKTRSKRPSVAIEAAEQTLVQPGESNVSVTRSDAVKNFESGSARMELTAVSEGDEKSSAQAGIAASTKETVQSVEENDSKELDNGPNSRKISTRMKNRKLIAKSEVDRNVPEPSVSVPLVQGSEKTRTKRMKRGRICRKRSEAQEQGTTLQIVESNEAKLAPIENSNNQQEPQRRRNTRSKSSIKQNSSAARESASDAEPKQTLATSAKSTTSKEQVDNSKTVKEDIFHQPELPVRKTRRCRAGSGASYASNASVRTDAESSDEATSNTKRTLKRSVSSAESSGDEQPAAKPKRAARQTCTVSDTTDTTQNVPLKRGRGRPRKDALDDSNSSGVSTSRHPRLSSLNATVSNSPTTETSRRRKRALAGQVRVLFTVINDDYERDIVARLGGKIVSHFKECSVLVTDRIRRTVKFLCCVGLGVPIVGRDWLEKCKNNGKFLDPWIYLLHDEEGEKKFNFKLADSLKVATEKPLLSGLVFHATPGVKPPPIEMQDIVDACGGFYVEEKDENSTENEFVITCVEDKKIWSGLKKRGAKLLDKEAILTGVLQQSFEPEKFAVGA